MRRTSLGFFSLLVCVFFIHTELSFTQGNTYYVSPSGIDNNPGTEALPWRTVQKAANTLEEGDTVYIKEGVFYERVIPKKSGSYGKYITYAAYQGASVSISGQGISVPSDSGLFHVKNKRYIRILGLKIEKAAGTSNSNGIYVYNSDFIRIENNHTYDTESSGIGVWGSSNIFIINNEVELACNDGEQECITVAGTDTFEIKNNRVHHGGPGSQGGEGIDVKDGSSRGKVYNNNVHHINRMGIYVDAWDRHTFSIDVYNNIVHDCTEDAFALASEAGGLLENIKVYNNLAFNNGYVGITIAGWGEPVPKHPLKDISLINNTFYNNGDGSWGGGISIENSDVRNLIIRNNIVSQNYMFQILVEAAVQNLSVDHNLIDGYRDHPDEIYGSSYVIGDPLFANVSQSDFHVQKNSPAIDNGSLLNAPEEDFEGDKRPYGKDCDIGADEYVSGSGPGKVTLISPSGLISDNTPTFSWAGASQATRYKLKVIGSSGTVFIKKYKASDICWDGTCSVTTNEALANGDYTWKVRPWNKSSGWGPWSAGMDFTISAGTNVPGPISPCGTVMDNTPTYTWSGVFGAVRYRLKVTGPSGTILSKKYKSAAISSDGTCSVTPKTILANGSYSWKVRSRTKGEAWRPWSSAMSFTVSGQVRKMKLAEVKYWAYNIQNCNSKRQRKELVGTHFDLYVLEPVVTEKGEENFNIVSLIQDIRQHNIKSRKVDPLILAYIDVGQAEDWRWYYDKVWKIGSPEWIVGGDPDDWEGCYPVAYWYDMWQNIVIYGYKGRSMVEESLKAGFDGIYMDWVEAFSDDNVVAKAEDNSVEPAAAMFDFIEKIRSYARYESPNANADYLVIAQNAPDLYEENPQRYRKIIDGIALEAIWYDGNGGFDNWNDPKGYNVPTNNLYPNWTEEVLAFLQPMKPHLPIFCVEYAQDLNGKNLASKVYLTLALAEGFIPYCSRRSLARLSKTPYPSGYNPKDY